MKKLFFVDLREHIYNLKNIYIERNQLFRVEFICIFLMYLVYYLYSYKIQRNKIAF